MNRKGDWANPSFAQALASEEVVTLSDLAKEGLRMAQAKKDKTKKEQEEAEEYKAKLRKIYKFKKFKEDPKTEKMIAELKETIDPRELDKYEKYLPTSKKKVQQKKLNIRLEAKQNDLDNSFNDENNSVDSNRSLRSAGAVEVDIEDADFKYYTAGMHHILNDLTIPALIADEQLKEALSKSQLGKSLSRKKTRKIKEEKKPEQIDVVKEVN